MKLIRIVKLQRVKYGDLSIDSDWVIPHNCESVRPPESESYTIEGIPGARIIQGDGVAVLRPSQIVFDESEIETRYI